MHHLKGLLKSSLLAAAGVVLPVLLLGMLLGKIISVSSSVTEPFARTVFPQLFQATPHASKIMALFFIVVASVCFGALAQTQRGRRMGHWIEDKTLMHLGIYRGFKEFSERLIPSKTNTLFQPALLIRSDEMNALVFVVEEFNNDHFVIFSPSVPSTFSGSLFIVPKKDVKILNAPVMDMAKVFSRWGVGTTQIISESQSAKDLQ